MSVKSSSSTGEAAGGEVVRVGYLKKLKTMRKKYFVLRAETADTSSRLEYYDNEKKYRSAQLPKRSISLKACFNINRRVDTKHKHVIALYTKDDCFCVVLESERDLDEWLKALLSLQRGEDVVDGEPPKPTFEHVWQVTMLNKGLGSSRNILGPYHLCFTDKTLSLVRKSVGGIGGTGGGNCGHPDHVEFSLMSIRRCGHSDCFFYVEVGRSAVTGAGELWMQTEDTNIAQNMGEVILRAMSNNNREDLAPKPRTRSSSANEASKPILVQRRQTHSGQKTTNYCSPNQAISGIVIFQPHIQQRLATRTFQRRHSVSAGGSVSWSGMVHHQRTQSLPLAPLVSHVHVENNNHTYLPRNIKRANNNSSSAKCTGGRERCDSMPSRARTSSEGTQPVTVTHPIRTHLQPHRPQSLYGRDISHSPPAGSPVSPASAACSTDSAGSSLSIDEPDAWPDYVDTPLSRYGHSLTPDEPIAEENCDETSDSPYVQHSPISSSPMTGGYVPMAPLSSDDGYVDMSPRGRHTDMSPAASSCSITSGTPSTDMRFSEYHLEKVTSYFTPSEEDDTSSVERPLRAYSVGSRPDVLKLRTKLDASLGNHENSRVRAFSVGSRAKNIHNRVLPPHGHPPSTGGKSSSAPLLSGSNVHLGSQSSIERMDDLMELDFSKPAQPNAGYVDMSPRNRSSAAGYVEMKPGLSDCTPTTPDLPYMDMRPSASPVKSSSISAHLDTTKEQHPYVDMRAMPITSPLKPSSMPLSNSSASSSGDYMDMKPSTSPHKSSSIPKYNSCYVQMSGNSKLGTSPKNNNKGSSPIQEEYMDMDFQFTRNNRTERTLSGASRTQPVDLPHPKKTSEGYMDMTWNRHERKSSLDSAKVNINNNDDYINMSGTGRKKDRKSSKKEKNRSQPITIQSSQPTKVVSSQSPVNSFTSFLQNSTRKNSTGTPPKHPPNFLPLTSCSYSPGSSPFSSLRRPRTRKLSRRDSKDSSGLVTPTSESSTIFPFSPGSPSKPFQTKSPDMATTRKCAVDASSGTVKIANASGKPPQIGSDYARMSNNLSNKVSMDYTEMNLENTKFSNQENSSKQANHIDLDYVNYCPTVSRQRNITGPSDEFGEYAIMRPVSIVQSTNTGNMQKIAPFICSQNSVTKKLSSLTMNNVNTKPCVFKPIIEPKEDTRLGAISPKPGDVAPHKSFENIRNEQESSSSALDGSFCSEIAECNYETLRGGSCVSPIAKIFRPDSIDSEKTTKSNSRAGSVSSDKCLSRPSSVSSETTKDSLSRPSSVSSELGSTSTIVSCSRPTSVNADLIARPSSVSSDRELHYASLDLALADDDGTRSPKNVKGQEGTRSPTPNSASAEPSFTYAEIDFIKSEGMKNNTVNNGKLKH